MGPRREGTMESSHDLQADVDLSVTIDRGRAADTVCEFRWAVNELGPRDGLRVRREDWRGPVRRTRVRPTAFACRRSRVMNEIAPGRGAA